VPLTLSDGSAEALYGSPIHYNNVNVGYVTSGGYGHCIKKSIALGYLRTDLAKPGTKLQVQILGEWRDAEVGAEPLFDPTNERPRTNA